MVEKNKKIVDLTPFLAFSLATNPRTTKDLDNLYEKHKFKAYEYAKKSKYYNYPLLADGSIKRDVFARKALGLIELSKEKKDIELNSDVINLFIKGWNSLFKYIEKTEVIDIDYIMKNIIKKKDNDDYYIGFTTATILFSEMLEKEIDPIEYKKEMSSFFYEYIEHLNKGEKRFSYTFVRKNKELFDKAKNIKNNFYDNFKIFNNTCDLVDLNINDEETADYCRSINVIFDSENMMLSSMSDNAPILEKDVIELAALYFIHNKNQNRVESTKFILFGLHLKYAIKAYKELKKFYFENNKETLYIELNKHIENIKTLEEENASLKRKTEILEHENNKLKKDYKNTIEKENIILENNIEKLKEQILQLEKDRKELIDLSESFFETDEKIIDIKENIVIPKTKAVIAGGHSSWHNKIKTELPETFIYIEGDNERFDTNLLDNKEFVFIYTKYMSHGFYYKLMGKCKKNNIKVLYITSSSPEHVKMEIYEKLTKESNWMEKLEFLYDFNERYELLLKKR